MPFTPFHFGPGLMVKSAIPRSYSWSAFVASQVFIDCETLYYLVQRAYPVHRTMHTFWGGTLAGLFVGALLIGLLRIVESSGTFKVDSIKLPSLRAELSQRGLLVGGLVGGASHPFLDGIMHTDIRPFMPWTEANPLLSLVDLGMLHLLCFAAGIFGVVAMSAWLAREKNERPGT